MPTLSRTTPMVGVELFMPVLIKNSVSGGSDGYYPPVFVYSRCPKVQLLMYATIRRRRRRRRRNPPSGHFFP